MRIRRQSAEQREFIDIAPLIDVMFILIIFFLATTTFQQEERDEQVNLPEAAQVQAISEAPKVIIINVRQDGTCLFGTKEMDLAGLQNALREAVKDNPDHKVLVRGDRMALHGHVAAAVLAAKQAGVREANLGYQARP